MDAIFAYGLLAVFVALLLAPFGLPIPEEISLVVAGALARTGNADVLWALVIGYAGVTLGDCCAWAMGRRVGLQPTGFLARLVGPDQIERIDLFYEKWGNWAILIARQFPGMRLPAFFFAGASGIRFSRFFLFDGTAALITTNVYVWIGFTFADDLDRVVPWIDRFRFIAFSVVGIAVTVIVYRIIRRQIRKAKRKRERDG